MDEQKKGFTLLEILLVVAAIAILAGVVIVAVNPGKQLADTRNATRQTEVKTISDAVYQYSFDHGGVFPSGIDTNLRMLGTGDAGCGVSCGSIGGSGGSVSTSTNTLSLTDNNQSTFSGTYTNTLYNAGINLINLVSPNTSGSYVSNVKDSGNASTWSTFSWISNRPTGKALPNNGQSETGYPAGNANMSGNVLLLHLDENSGATTFTDNSGSGNNGSCSGNACPTMGATGKLGTAASFNGTNNYLKINNNPLYKSSATTFTLSLWTYLSKQSFAGTAKIFFDDSNGGPATNNGLWFGPDDRGGINPVSGLQLVFRTATGGARVIECSNCIGNLDWYHIVGTYDGSHGKIYVNGVDKTTVDGSAAWSGTGNFIPRNALINIGAISSFTANFFSGLIDEAVIFNRALTAAEVADQYKRGALSLKHQIRSCTNADCSDGTFVGPDGTANTYYSEANNTSNSTPLFSLNNVANNRYFQYKSFLDTSDASVTPELQSVGMSGSQTVTTVSGGNSGASSTLDACLDLSSQLVSDYLNAIPVDSKLGSANNTYYAIKKTSGGRISVQACAAENGKSIVATK